MKSLSNIFPKKAAILVIPLCTFFAEVNGQSKNALYELVDGPDFSMVFKTEISSSKGVEEVERRIAIDIDGHFVKTPRGIRLAESYLAQLNPADAEVSAELQRKADLARNSKSLSLVWIKDHLINAHGFREHDLKVFQQFAALFLADKDKLPDPYKQKVNGNMKEYKFQLVRPE